MRATRSLVFLLTGMLAGGGVSAFAQNRVEVLRPAALSMIGVRLADVTPDDVKGLKLPKAEGAIVESVAPNSPATTAGVREKDVIVEFDGERVRSASHLTRLVAETPAGRDVAMTIIRDGKRSEMHVKPEAGNPFGVMDRDQMRELGQEIGRQAREMSRSLPEVVDGARAGVTRGRLGASVQELSPDLAEYFGVKAGVLVASVEKESPAHKAGLRAGDVITAVDGHNVTSPAELIGALPAGSESHDVNLTVVREKKELKISAKIEPVGVRRPVRRGTPA